MNTSSALLPVPLLEILGILDRAAAVRYPARMSIRESIVGHRSVWHGGLCLDSEL